MNYYPLLQKRNFWGELKKAPGKKRYTYISPLIEQADNDNISAVMGVRRSGKSTIILQVIEELVSKHSVRPLNTLFINFEDPRLSQLLLDNNLLALVDEFYEAADNRSTVYFFFDEIQNVVNWEAIIRTIQDTYDKCKIYVTGSSASLLGSELATKLSGRYISNEVFPLSFKEFTKFNSNSSVAEYISRGAFPDVVTTKSAGIRTQLLQDYFDSILLRDIASRHGLRNEFKLKRLSQTLFANISNQASSYRLSKDLGLSADTVLQYFKYIEDAYLGFFVTKLENSLRKQEYNPKKFYSIDTALQAAVSFRTLDNMGKLFENIVYLELRRKYNDIYYWEEEKEVDFVVKQGEHVQLLCNATVSIDSTQTKEREITALQAAMHFFDKNESILVVKEAKEEVIKTEVGQIHVVPFYKFVSII